MSNVVLALAGFALIVPAAKADRPAMPLSKSVSSKQPGSRQVGSRKAGPKPAGPKAAGATKVEIPIIASDATTRVAGWVAASGDNRALPYAIIDKIGASLFLFDGKGTPLGAVPVLIGVATGDDATPGIGSKNLAEIGPAEKTTPAGRFLAKFGLAAGRERILWVDYATSVALHPIPKGASKTEQRRARMLSPSPDDNRITFGCINVPSVFYGKSLRPLFQRKGGYVYVLPDTKPIETVFPRLRVQALTDGGAQSDIASSPHFR